METFEIRSKLNRWQLKETGKSAPLATLVTRDQVLDLADTMFANRAVRVKVHKPNGQLEEERVYPKAPAKPRRA